MNGTIESFFHSYPGLCILSLIALPSTSEGSQLEVSNKSAINVSFAKCHRFKCPGINHKPARRGGS